MIYSSKKTHTICTLSLLAITTAVQAQATANAYQFTQAFHNGLSLMKQNEYEQAQKAFENALCLNPHSAEAYFNIGVIYLKCNKIDNAITAFENCAKYNKNYAKAYFNLGSLYKEQKNIPKAIEAYRTCLELEPARTKLHALVATMFKEQKNIKDAQVHYRKAIQADEKNLQLKLDAANMLCTNGYPDEAVTLYREIIAQSPHAYPIMGNMAHALRYQGKMEEAISYYQKVLSVNPNDTHIRYGIAEAYLTLGEFEKGWEKFSTHWKRGPDTRNFGEKIWDGSDLHGKKIFLRTVYGQGDTIQFIRYAQLLKQQGAYIIAEVQHSLVNLLRLSPYLDEVIAVDEQPKALPAFDAQIITMNLPYMFKTTESTIPATVPYLEADQQLVQYWADKTAHDKNFKVGLCWHASTYYESFKSSQQRKSLPLDIFLPLLTAKNISMYSLQLLDGSEQTNTLPSDAQIHTFQDFDNSHGRFMDTAALIENLDLVITIDTSVAHLAGALGKPVWVLLPYSADWRWMQKRTDSPWYPTMRLFRQTEIGNWNPIITHLIDEIIKLNTVDYNQAKKTTTVDASAICTEVSLGELLDKITILQIKNEKIKDDTKLKNIHAELNTLQATFEKYIQAPLELEKLMHELREANKKLWKIEDDIREKEHEQAFDNEFIELARSVYFTNDRRCEIKRAINKLLGSRLVEEKSYADYKATAPQNG